MSKALKIPVAISAVILLLAVSVAVAYYNRSDAFVYIAMLWLAACILIVWRTKSNFRLWALYAGAAVLTLGLYEAWLAGWFSKPAPQLVNFSISDPTYFQPHPILGVVPKKAMQVRTTKTYGNEQVYDVRYTIDASGLRMSSLAGQDSAPAVLFFGCSFTFGEGVNDNETMPYQFAEKAHGRFKAYNFGFHGYGPHHMLARLENEMEKSVIAGHAPRYAVYQALTGHVDRCAGRAWWDTAGPRYALNAQGEAVYAGPFHNFFASRFITLMTRSSIVRRRLSTQQEITAADIDLFAGIVKKSEKIFRARYGGKFYVLLWNDESAVSAEILAKLAAQNISVIGIAAILPDLKADGKKYRLPMDGHPSPFAYAKIAEYLLKVLSEDPS